MLTLTRFGRPTLGALGATPSVKREMAVIYGVPFPVTKINGPLGAYYENRNYSGSGSFSDAPYSTVVVPKKRLPKEARDRIDQAFGKWVTRVAGRDPALYKDPKALLKAAKAASGLVGDSELYRKSTLYDDWRHLIIGTLSKIGSVDVSGKEWWVSVREVNAGHDYEFKLRKISSGTAFDEIVGIVAKPAEWGAKVLVATVDAVKDSLEAALELVAELLKSLCKIADNDIVKLASAYAGAGAQGEVKNVAVAFSTGDKEALTKTVANVYAGGNAAKIAAVGSALGKLQSFCGGPAAGGGGAAKKKVRWPLIVGASIGGAALLGGAGWLAFGGKRRRR